MFVSESCERCSSESPERLSLPEKKNTEQAKKRIHIDEDIYIDVGGTGSVRPSG